MKEILKRALIKLTSTKAWLLIWSCFLITYIIVKNLVTFNNLCMLLIAVPLSYFPTNILQHFLNKKETKDGEQ